MEVHWVSAYIRQVVGGRGKVRGGKLEGSVQVWEPYLSRALAHSWRPRARPSFMRAVLMTSWRAVMTSILAGGASSTTTGVSLRWIVNGEVGLG